MSGLVLEEFAPLYAACARAFRWSPRQVDELEIWEVAEVLDSLIPDDQKVKTAPGMTAPALTGSALLKARVAHSRGQGPKPEAAPMGATGSVLGSTLAKGGKP